MSTTLVPSTHDKWLKVKVRQELDICESDHTTDLFSTDTFEVQAVPWGDGIMEIRIRPVPPKDDDRIKECHHIGCCVPVDQLERAMAGIADSIFDLWYNENSVFDQDMNAVHMYPGKREFTDFPDGYAAFQETEGSPIYVFRKEIWSPYKPYVETRRIIQEIFDTDEVTNAIVVLDHRTKFKTVPKKCVMYVNCAAGDDIHNDIF